MKRLILSLTLLSLSLLFLPKNSLFCEESNQKSKKKLYLSLTRTIMKGGQVSQRPTLALFDTSKTEEYAYNPLIEIAKSTNFDVIYYPVSKVIDDPNHEIPLKKFDCACFIMCPEFLKTVETSPVSQKILALMKSFSSNPHKVTILMFPSMPISHPNPIGTLTTLLESANIGNPAQQHDEAFYSLTNRFLRYPIETRLTYHTTLKLPGNGLPFNVTQELNDNAKIALLPIRQDHFAKEIKNLFPLGVYSFNYNNKNHTIITSTAVLFSGIAENFKLCPIDFELRKELHNAVHEMMFEINKIATQRPNIEGIDIQSILTAERSKIPATIASIGTTTVKNRKNQKIAWMELNPTDQMIQFILDSRLDHLWITLNPQEYYSPIAKSKRKEKEFFKKLSIFTKKLAYMAKSQKIRPPTILVGFEIVNNFYAPNLPENPAQDLYKNEYTDIPRPLERTFFEDEIIHPLKMFVKKWKNHKISNGIKLGGVVLDLEMYGRKTVGSILPTMGFEPTTIREYLKAPLTLTINAENFSQYLIDNNMSKQYFFHLENQAQLLGERLKRVFNEQIPNGIIGCYAPNISVDWFYKGLYSGLSTPKKPISLFSFNSEFESHRKWLEKNDIFARHIGVLMLSKIKNLKDLEKFAKHICNHHNGGIWLNRFSWLDQKYKPKHWSVLEQTRLSMKNRKKFAKLLGGLKKPSLDTPAFAQGLRRVLGTNGSN